MSLSWRNECVIKRHIVKQESFCFFLDLAAVVEEIIINILTCYSHSQQRLQIDVMNKFS